MPLIICFLSVTLSKFDTSLSKSNCLIILKFRLYTARIYDFHLLQLSNTYTFPFTKDLICYNTANLSALFSHVQYLLEKSF